MGHDQALANIIATKAFGRDLGTAVSETSPPKVTLNVLKGPRPRAINLSGILKNKPISATSL